MRSSEKTSLRARADILSIEHDDLDAAIAALLKSGLCDDLLVKRLKKRKLQIKDEIAGLLEPGERAPVAQAS